MGRVGLVDITVGNAARASAHRNVPPRDAARRTASLRKRANRWGHPGGSRVFSAGRSLNDLITDTAANLKARLCEVNRLRDRIWKAQLSARIAAHRP
jgi:hypothetical protein